MADDPLVFCHLSDIHFSPTSGGVYDPDEDLRHELELDAKNMAERLGRIDGVLVTGDIAFSGAKEEFAFAADWLNKLSACIGAEKGKIWVTPGNHDVDRSAMASSPILQTLQERLRSEGPSSIDDLLVGHLRDREAGPMMFRPLNNYNEFADKFQCRIDAKDPVWWYPLNLNDGWTLELRGLNSTIISGPGDDPSTGKLVLGSFQATSIRRRERVVYLTLCHHPPEWLIDQESVESVLNARAKIQLFGHKHSQQIQKINETLVLTAGAMQPERHVGGWEPRYNWLVIWIDAAGAPTLCVDVYPRVWDQTNSRFAAHYRDGGLDRWEYRLALDDEDSAANSVKQDELTLGRSEEPTDSSSELTDQMEDESRPEAKALSRRLHYRFFDLPYRKAMGIAQELELLQDTDKSLTGAELLNSLLRRVDERNLVDELRELVQKAEEAG